MPLKQSIKDMMSKEYGVPFDDIREDSRSKKTAIFSSRMLSRFLKRKKSPVIEKDVPLPGRGYVNIGKGVSAEEIDRLNMQILSRW
jgi:hypothetical protein